ncbi:MAG: hypothetical protein R6W92_12445 [Desulfocurvibacter africanus]
MSVEELQAQYGRPLKPKQVAKLFCLDVRTVKKHFATLGGVEVIPGVPGTLRFFENRIRSILDADRNDSAWSSALARHCEDGRQDTGVQMVRQRPQGTTQSNPVGRRDQESPTDATEDPHGLARALGMGE